MLEVRRAVAQLLLVSRCGRELLQGKCERAAAQSQGAAPKVTRESAENTEPSLWPAGGAEPLRLPPWPGAKSVGRSRWPKPVAEADGRSRWQKPMAEADGRGRWPKPIAEANGRSRWPKPMAEADGLSQWPKPMAEVDGQSRWPMAVADALASQHVVPELVHRARRPIAAALARRSLVAAWASTTPTPC